MRIILQYFFIHIKFSIEKKIFPLLYHFILLCLLCLNLCIFSPSTLSYRGLLPFDGLWFLFLIVLSVTFYHWSFSTKSCFLLPYSQNIVHESSVTEWPSRNGSHMQQQQQHRYPTCYYFIWSHFTQLFRLYQTSTLLHLYTSKVSKHQNKELIVSIPILDHHQPVKRIPNFSVPLKNICKVIQEKMRWHSPGRGNRKWGSVRKETWKIRWL